MAGEVWDVELVLDAGAELGEGPSWDERRAALLWVDITGRRVHVFDPATGADEAIAVERLVSAAIPTAGERILLCQQGQIALLDPEGGALEVVAPLEAGVAENRTNDAKCDPDGRLWVGTMACDVAPHAGALYRLDAGGPRVVVPATTCSNGIAWSPDGATMYYIDSLAGGIDAYAYEPGSGDIADRRRLIGVPEGEGLPDGLCVDAEGYLWFAVWGDGSLRRHAPDGAFDRRVAVPARNVTSCCFGGAGLDDLYVTSARSDDPDDAAGGGLFRLRPGVAGLPTNSFAYSVA